MSDDDFERLINKAVDGLPREFYHRLENVNLVISDWPSTYQLKSQGNERGRSMLLGLYEGIPQIKRGSYGIGGPLPDKITIFKNPILMISRNNDEIEKNVKETVIHEIAHHFGMSDLDIKNAKNDITRGGDYK